MKELTDQQILNLGAVFGSLAKEPAWLELCEFLRTEELYVKDQALTEATTMEQVRFFGGYAVALEFVRHIPETILLQAKAVQNRLRQKEEEVEALVARQYAGEGTVTGA